MRGDLPDREVAYTLIQDHVKPELLFVGTEFGLYVTIDEGSHWHRLKGGFPTMQVRDLEIQRDWNDLAVATFGRGFYILDDYTPLRAMTEDGLATDEAILFPTREALLYIEQPDRVGDRGKGFWTTPNPPFGAVFTYWLRDGLKTKTDLRIEAETKAREDETDAPLRTMEELRAEDLELEPAVFLTVRDGQGSLVRRVKAEPGAGLHRVAWDLRLPPAAPTNLTPRSQSVSMGNAREGSTRLSGLLHGSPRSEGRDGMATARWAGGFRSRAAESGDPDARRPGRCHGFPPRRFANCGATSLAPPRFSARSTSASVICDRPCWIRRRPIRPCWSSWKVSRASWIRFSSHSRAIGPGRVETSSRHPRSSDAWSASHQTSGTRRRLQRRPTNRLTSGRRRPTRLSSPR